MMISAQACSKRMRESLLIQMQATVAQQAAVDTISAGKQAAALHNAGPEVQRTTATAAAAAVTQ